jgi:hypothetical protein
LKLAIFSNGCSQHSDTPNPINQFIIEALHIKAR